MAAGDQRIDKWLFFARVVKSRSVAQKLAVSGAVRVNREKIAHAARIVRPGDVLTLQVQDRVRVLKILDAGLRRGPASEAALLFEDLTPVPAVDETSPAAAIERPSRPTKRERRDAQRLNEGAAED